MIVRTGALLCLAGYGRHMYFRYNATSGYVCDNVVEPDYIESMDVGV